MKINLLVLLFVLLGLVSCSPSKVGDSEAFIISKDFVKQHLKSPSSADFDGSYTSKLLPDGSYRIVSTIEAQNAFGVKLKENWVERLKYNGGDWTDDANWSILELRIGSDEMITNSEVPTSNTEAELSPMPSIQDFKYVLSHINNEDAIDSLTAALGFEKRFSGVYVTKALDGNGMPVSWIKTFSNLQNMSFMTCQPDSFKALISRIKKTEHFKAETFNDGTSDMAMKLIGRKFTYETYIPRNGINTKLNDYDEMIIYNTKTKQ